MPPTRNYLVTLTRYVGEIESRITIKVEAFNRDHSQSLAECILRGWKATATQIT